MFRLVLPPIINAAGLLPFLAQLDSVPEFENDIVLNFAGLRRVSPAAVTSLVAVVQRWRAQHRRVTFEGLLDCAIAGYLQRMDVLRHCGIEMDEVFTEGTRAPHLVQR